MSMPLARRHAHPRLRRVGACHPFCSLVPTLPHGNQYPNYVRFHKRKQNRQQQHQFPDVSFPLSILGELSRLDLGDPGLWPIQCNQDHCHQRGDGRDGVRRHVLPVAKQPPLGRRPVAAALTSA